MIWTPAPDNVVDIHNELVEVFIAEEDPISPAGVKNQAMLESACARPATGLGAYEKYGTVCEKVAALFHSLVKNHPFHNGNKRTALVAALSTLHRNDFRLRSDVSDDQIYDLTVAVAANLFPSAEEAADNDKITAALSSWFRDHTEKLSHTVEGMRADEFVERCRQAGARVKPAGKGRSISISHNGRSISFNKNSSSFPGKVVMRYLRTLRLSESGVGIGLPEFQEGASDERHEIYRFMAALRRLAKT